MMVDYNRRGYRAAISASMPNTAYLRSRVDNTISSKEKPRIVIVSGSVTPSQIFWSVFLIGKSGIVAYQT